jgi:hypothetical protein
MLAALATDRERLFLIAGPLQAAAIILFLITIVPLVLRMPGVSQPAVLAAACFLMTGVSLGAWFAADAAIGARLRLVHAEINLFGWIGLLIAGVGYYLAPRFAGRPLRWPRLAPVQLALLGSGVLAGSIALAFRAYGHVSTTAIIGSHALLAAGFALFGLLIAGTFFRRQSSPPPFPRSISAQLRASPATPAQDSEADGKRFHRQPNPRRPRRDAARRPGAPVFVALM